MTEQDAQSNGETARLLARDPVLWQYIDGRLGLRAGELVHLDTEWVDWDRDRITIPSHHRCARGTDNGVCGYCRHQARSSYRCATDEALARRWEPKTDAAARAVPFGWDAEVGATVAAFFAEYERWPTSRATVNRRVDRLAEAAGLEAAAIYPHCLRATAGSYHAYRGVGTAALMNLMGWSQLETAQAYIRRSGEATADALDRAHGGQA